MTTHADVLKTKEDALSVEDRASAAAHARFAEWRKAELEQRPRRILYFVVAVVVIVIAVVALMLQSPR
jgi:hypothetical protein